MTKGVRFYLLSGVLLIASVALTFVAIGSGTVTGWPQAALIVGAAVALTGSITALWYGRNGATRQAPTSQPPRGR